MSLTEQSVFRAEQVDSATRLGRTWRKHRFWIICAAIFLVVTLIGYLVANSGERDSGTLSITNLAPGGAQAAATILGHQGVTVTATDSLAATEQALATNGSGNSTVLFYDPKNLLAANDVSRLAASVEGAGGRLVAVAPGPLAVPALSPELASTGTAAATGTVQHGCSNGDAQAAVSIDGGAPVPGTAATAVTTPLLLFKGAQTCFMPPGSAADGGGFLASNSAGDIFALGNPGVLINQNLANQGNSALTFRLLGSKPQLLWYTATVKDLPVATTPPSLAELTPKWIFPAALWLLLVAVLGMVWRGRRNGPLVTEPLPVIVKSAETLVGRARLYQDARALDMATATLRHATLTRLARTLRLGNGADSAAVVQVVAEATGRKQPDLQALLYGTVPANEKQMLSMAVELTALEEEVARR